MRKTRVICLMLVAILLAGLPMSAFAQAGEQEIFIKAGQAQKQEDGSYRFEKLELSGGPVLGIQISFADQMRQGDALVAPEKLPEGIAANEALTSHAMLSFDVDPSKADAEEIEAFLRSLAFLKGEQTEELQVYFNLSGEKLYRQVFYFAANDTYYEIFFSPCCALPVRHMDMETFVQTEGVYPVVRGYSERLDQLAQYVTYRGMQGKPARVPDEATDNFLWEVLNFGATIGAIYVEDGWYWMDEKGEATSEKVEYARIAETEPRYGNYLHYSINYQKEDDGRHGLRSAAGNHQCTGYLIEYDSSLLAQDAGQAENYASDVGKAGGNGNLLWLGWVLIGILAAAGLAWAVWEKSKRKKGQEK